MTATTRTTLQRCLAALATVLTGALLLAACGGGTDRTKAHVRLLNGSTAYAGLDMRVHDTVRQSNVAYAAEQGYADIDISETDTAITSAGSSTALVAFTPSLSKNKYYTVLAFGALGGLRQLTLDEDTSQPDTNRSLLRIANAAPDAGSLDIYLTGTSDTLAASTPVQSAAGYGTLNGFLTIVSGNWRLRVTATGSKTDVRLDISSLQLSSKQIATLVLAPGRGGALINALLVTQQGSVARLDNTQARVRVAAGVTDAATVVATVGGNTLLSNNAVVIGNYTAVASGSQPVAVTVNSAALTTAAKTLNASADYTLLVYGPSTAPVVSWVEDDNSLPSDTSQARVRLVNGTSGLSGALSLTVDLAPAADTTAVGAGSAYTLVPPNTTSRLSVIASGSSTNLFPATDQTFLAGSTYTVFVLGGSGNISATLRRDR